MGHFPPPGPVGRIGVFYARRSPSSSSVVRLYEGRGASRSLSLTGRSPTVAGGARAARRQGATSGPLQRTIRSRGRRIHAGREGLRDRRGALLPGTLGGRGTGVRGATDLPVRAGSSGVQGDTIDSRGARRGPVGDRRGDLRCPWPCPPAGAGSRLAPRALSRRAGGRERQEPPRRRAREDWGGGGG